MSKLWSVDDLMLAHDEGQPLPAPIRRALEADDLVFTQGRHITLVTVDGPRVAKPGEAIAVAGKGLRLVR